MTTEARCSFCGITIRELHGQPMIAGPSVFICAGCVQLAAEIVVEGKTENGVMREVGAAADAFATMGKQLHEATTKIARMDAAMRAIAREVARVIEGPHSVRCMWCDAGLEHEQAARDHVATCERHPAVIRLRELEASR